MYNIKISMVDKARRAYIDKYLESAKKIDYTELNEQNGAIKVLYEDLPKTVVNGFPVASDFVTEDGRIYSGDDYAHMSSQERAACKLRYYYLPCTHEMYIGATGSGKTTGCVEPQLRALAYQKNKPNLFVTDPKGELFEHNAQHLKDNGYRLFVLNFKELDRSDKWNPFLELFEKQMELNSLDHGVTMHTGEVPDYLEKYDDPEDYNGEYYVEFNGTAFCSGDSLECYMSFKRDLLTAEISSIVNQFANMFVTVENQKDPTWEYGAQELIKGLLQCMLEDATNREDFTEDMMTIKTMHQYYQALRVPILARDNRYSDSVTLYSHPLTKDKSADALRNMATALNNANNTMKSYCGVFDGATKDWFQSHIFALTTGNTVNIDDLDNSPFAIFVITRDYDKSDFKVAGLFIDWVYRKIIEKTERGEYVRPTHFLLDEFANVPPIKDFENKIATARSRNIWFHIVLQSYSQLDHVYGDDRAAIIKDNCNSQVFLGAQNRKTREIFSEDCGRHSIPSLRTVLNPTVEEIVEVPLVPVSNLDMITPGEMYYKRLYMPLISTRFVRSYIAAAHGSYKGFFDSHGLKTCTPRNREPFNSLKYTFPPLVKDYMHLLD